MFIPHGRYNNICIDLHNGMMSLTPEIATYVMKLNRQSYYNLLLVCKTIQSLYVIALINAKFMCFHLFKTSFNFSNPIKNTTKIFEECLF